jgi:hypothetical protein
MSDHSTPAAPIEDTELFTASEIKEFDKDDVEAGRNICKMLSLFFFYTVIVMGISTLVTWRWVTGG